MGRGPRKWIKVFCYETLHGSICYQLTDEEQAVWIKLLCFAGLCGNDGVIADHDLRPFPDAFIIHEIHTSQELFTSTVDKCKAEGRISVNGGGAITITNWQRYQSEYERQKKYRHGAREPLDEKAAEEENQRRIDAWEAAHPGRKHPVTLEKERIAKEESCTDSETE